MRNGWRSWLAPGLASAVALCAPALAQQKKPANDPASCPYCHGDPALMKAAGIVSHGPFDFGKNDTAKVDEFMSSSDIRWIESANFKIGFGLAPVKVKFEEKKKVLAELTRLHAALPDVKPDAGFIDSWLRTHLYAQRAEDIWKRFVEIAKLEGMTFADGTGVYRGAYKGEGPFLGMKRKYEVMILPSEASHVTFLTEHAGMRVRYAQRWHYTTQGAIAVMMHAQEGKLRTDAALHAALGFNLAHNLYDGLNHYSYDTPVWLHEGLAHFMEREIDPNYNSFDSGEGAVADMTSKTNWKPDVLKLIDTGEAARIAELLALKSFAELKLPHHFVTWSMVDYLVKTNPDGFAKFLLALKNCNDERGVPTGVNMPEVHRQKFKECFGMNYAEFDEAWRAWCKINYKPTVPKGPEPGSEVPIPGRGAPMGGGG